MSRPLLANAVFVLALLAVACGKPAQSAAPTLPTIGAEGGGRDGSPATDLWRDRNDLIALPTATPPMPIALPQLSQFKLANGLAVFVVSDSHSPMVSTQLAIRNGWSSDPANQPGLAAFAAQMLIRGNAGRDAAAVAKAIAATGGALTSDASYEATVMKCDAQAQYVDTCLRLLSGAVMAPTFAKTEMPVVGEHLAGQVKSAAENPGTLAAMHAQNVLWSNDHARGRSMSMESLRSITRDDLVAWHKAAIRPERGILVIVGNISPAAVKSATTALFGKWKGSGKALAPVVDATPIINRTIRLIDFPGQGQAQIAVAVPGIAHQDSRFFDMLVWNHVLGGGATSRLAVSIRGGSSQGYGASSTFDRNNDRGAWVATGASRTTDAAATLTAMLREIKRMQAEGPSDEEVADAVTNLAGSYGLRFETASALASSILAAQLHNFDEAYIQNFPVVLGKSSRASVADAAASTLGTNSVAIAIVGDAARIAPQLDKLKVTYEKVSAGDPITPVRPPTLPDDPKLNARARAMLDAALTKKGGKAALKSRKSLRLEATGAIKKPGQVIDVSLTRVWSIPNESRVDLVLNNAIRISYAMGAAGAWQDSPNGVADVPAAESATVERERWLDPDFILLRYLEPGATVRWVGEETIAGVMLTKVNVSSADQRFTATLFIENKTKLVTMVAFPESAGVGTIGLEDYRSIDGILVAHKRTTFGGDETVALAISKFEWNVPVTATLFAKPKVSANAHTAKPPLEPASPGTKPAPGTP